MSIKSSPCPDLYHHIQQAHTASIRTIASIHSIHPQHSHTTSALSIHTLHLPSASILSYHPQHLPISRRLQKVEHPSLSITDNQPSVTMASGIGGYAGSPVNCYGMVIGSDKATISVCAIHDPKEPNPNPVPVIFPSGSRFISFINAPKEKGEEDWRHCNVDLNPRDPNSIPHGGDILEMKWWPSFINNNTIIWTCGRWYRCQLENADKTEREW